MRLLIAVFTVVAGLSWALPDLSAGAASFVGRPGSLRSPRIHRPHVFPRGFQPFGFVGVGSGVIDEQPTVIIIQQFQSAPAPANQPNEPAQEKVYVQPHWVDGGHGVQVLAPGYWTAPKQAPEH